LLAVLIKRNHIEKAFQRDLKAVWHVICESQMRTAAFKGRVLSFLEPWGGAVIATNFLADRVNGPREVKPSKERRRIPRHAHRLPLTLSLFNRDPIFEGCMIN
jgi:hypothetical protein